RRNRDAGAALGLRRHRLDVGTKLLPYRNMGRRGLSTRRRVPTATSTGITGTMPQSACGPRRTSAPVVRVVRPGGFPCISVKNNTATTGSLADGTGFFGGPERGWAAASGSLRLGIRKGFHAPANCVLAAKPLAGVG